MIRRGVGQSGLSGTAARYWRLSLIAGATVIAVVALLLTVLMRTVDGINGGVSAIWTTGKNIANNTVHVPLIVRTNQIVDEILSAADEIAVEATRIYAAVSGKERG